MLHYVESILPATVQEGVRPSLLTRLVHLAHPVLSPPHLCFLVSTSLRRVYPVQEGVCPPLLTCLVHLAHPVLSPPHLRFLVSASLRRVYPVQEGVCPPLLTWLILSSLLVTCAFW